MRSGSGSQLTGSMREETEKPESAAMVGGVRWLGGVPARERSPHHAAQADTAETTFVIGRAHGPRLLELLCAAG